MKKLILSAAILFGSLSLTAASTPVQNSTEKTISIADKYTEIKAEELPSAVTESLKKSHPEAVITKAYVNENKQYKLEISIGDKSETVFLDASGNAVEK